MKQSKRSRVAIELAPKGGPLVRFDPHGAKAFDAFCAALDSAAAQCRPNDPAPRYQQVRVWVGARWPLPASAILGMRRWVDALFHDLYEDPVIEPR